MTHESKARGEANPNPSALEGELRKLLVSLYGRVDHAEVNAALVTLNALLDALAAQREALELVRGIIVDAAMVGFNCHEGDWAQRLFASQAVTKAALSPSPTSTE